MLASFHSGGGVPQDKLLLGDWHRDELMLTAQFFSSNAGILSGPVALASSSALSTTHTSSSVNDMSEMVVCMGVLEIDAFVFSVSLHEEQYSVVSLEYLCLEKLN